MSTYSDHEQRLLDQQTGEEMDRQAQRREANSSNQWCTYQRLGSIEARAWSTEDEYEFQCGIGPRRVSISPADRETGKVHGLHGGMVARNPANHDDQWYVAAEYFSKHYGRAVETPTELEQLRRIDRAARAFVDAYPRRAPPPVKNEFDLLCDALFDGRPAVKTNGAPT